MLCAVNRLERAAVHTARMKIEAKEYLHMTAVIFDSLTLVKRLRASGIPDPQAESIVEMTRDALAQAASKNDIDAAIRTLDPKFAEIDQRFVKIDQRFEEVDKRFEEVDQRFEEVDQRLAKIELRFDAVEMRLTKIEQRLDALEHRFELVEQQFTILEQRLTMKLGTIVVIALGAFTAISKLIS